ncbi:putative Mn2+ efflux pump MntP [Pasteurella langaaensis DSM 22999]|uniref:Putative manganese efflux pump MntP n=1 Tax=Alitibacter langaaensis DSM 22999 TaxID=1122935 RepID=A0A2U0TCZ8_9PAST|nr:manganese efflux pump MntP family protein [Pasteurella langaaensis]PVX41394.1 putative Mn2+ efflux pump MntP [Pasteurella langaaensis DSM 22999]
MSYYTLWAIAFGLSMDAFAVAVAKGLCLIEFSWKFALRIALCFGLFQALMPLLGYYIGSHFSQFTREIDHWIAFALLGLIGINMIREALSEDNDEEDLTDFTLKHLLTLGIATSIDALAMGISFAFLQVNIGESVAIIGATTAILCIIGVKAGHWLGRKIRQQAELLGGLMLIAIGVHVLYEHHVFG